MAIAVLLLLLLRAPDTGEIEPGFVPLGLEDEPAALAWLESGVILRDLNSSGFVLRLCLASCADTGLAPEPAPVDTLLRSGVLALIALPEELAPPVVIQLALE